LTSHSVSFTQAGKIAYLEGKAYGSVNGVIFCFSLAVFFILYGFYVVEDC